MVIIYFCINIHLIFNSKRKFKNECFRFTQVKNETINISLRIGRSLHRWFRILTAPFNVRLLLMNVMLLVNVLNNPYGSNLYPILTNVSHERLSDDIPC